MDETQKEIQRWREKRALFVLGRQKMRLPSVLLLLAEARDLGEKEPHEEIPMNKKGRESGP